MLNWLDHHFLFLFGFIYVWTELNSIAWIFHCRCFIQKLKINSLFVLIKRILWFFILRQYFHPWSTFLLRRHIRWSSIWLHKSDTSFIHSISNFILYFILIWLLMNMLLLYVIVIIIFFYTLITYLPENFNRFN
jgi:hypothetical protein